MQQNFQTFLCVESMGGIRPTESIVESVDTEN